MNAAGVTAPEQVIAGSRKEWAWWRLVAAEVLKLRRRRGLMAFATLLTVVPMLIGYSITIFLHATDANHHGPGGGIDNLSGSLDVLQTLGGVAALLIGATLGAGDLGAGVFRELVVTGRSRTALYTARIPAGLAVVLPFLTAGFLVAAVASVAFAGSLETPSGELLVRSYAWLAVTAAASLIVALGVASLIGSRSTSIGVLLAWQLGLVNLLLAFSFLGVTREALLPAATSHLAPAALNLEPPVTISLPAAALTITIWTLATLAVGGWRTITRDA
jgi:hypothetical protein